MCVPVHKTLIMVRYVIKGIDEKSRNHCVLPSSAIYEVEFYRQSKNDSNPAMVPGASGPTTIALYINYAKPDNKPFR